MSSSGGAMLSKEEENDAEVRREDQENINSFGRLNARLQEVQEEQAILKKQMEQVDDASTELMMGSGENVMLYLGNAFFETTEDVATEFCENEVEKLQETVNNLENEEEEITDEMATLKKVLYGRFGKSINLEA